MTSITSARLNEEPVLVISISHSSPGIACLTKMTAPSNRAMKWPPWATFSIVTLIFCPTARVVLFVDDIKLSLVEFAVREIFLASSSKLLLCT
jgi:hypothetical protein